MMKRLGIRSFFITLFLVIASFFNVANSSFVVEGEAKQENIAINEGNKAVCYNARTGAKYTTIEKALLAAKDDTDNNDTIYVIPGTNPTITANCEIASGDTLCLPYEGTNATTNRKNTDMGDFADSTAANVTANRKNLVTLSSGKTITNNGTLIIGGIVGIQSNVPSGHTGKSYTELLLNSNASIINKGIITLHGYIKEASTNNGSSIIHKSGAKITEPLVIYDYKGGSYSKACASEKIMPFSIYDLPNCQVYQKFEYGSYLIGMITLYVPSFKVWATSEANILAPSSESALFKQSSGFVSIKYTPADCRYTTNDAKENNAANNANITTVHSNGNISLSSLMFSMPLVGNIDSKDYDCPICYKFRINIETGTLDINNKMKFMGGSEVTIFPGASVNINSSTIFYQNYVPNIVYTTKAYPTVFHTAKLINNGLLTINSSFGGFISTSNSSSKTITSSTFSSNVIVYEALNISGSSLSASVSEKQEHNENAIKTLLKATYDDLTDTDFIYESLGNAQISSNSTYISHNITSSADYGWISNTSNDVTYGIKFIDNNGTINNPNSGIITSFQRSGSNITLENPTNSDTNYVFDGFYYDNAMTKKLSLTGDNYIIEPAVAEQYLSGNHVNIYSKWIDSTAYKYKLKFEYSETTDYQNVSTATSSENEFMISEGVILEPRSDFYIIDVGNLTEGTGRIIQYVFDGYLINVQDSNNNNKISNHKVDKTGSSGYFTNFKMSGDVGLTILSDGDIITATATYVQKTTDYNLDISFDKTEIASKGTGNASINTVDIFSTLGVALTYSWSCNYPKLAFANPNGQSTLMTNNSKPVISKTVDKNISCAITANNIKIATLTKSIKLVVGSWE